jgi:hypothetical protein
MSEIIRNIGGWSIVKVTFPDEDPFYVIFGIWKGVYHKGVEWEFLISDSLLGVIEEKDGVLFWPQDSGLCYELSEEYEGRLGWHGEGAFARLLEVAVPDSCVTEVVKHC